MQNSLSVIIPVYKVTEESRIKYFKYLIESISQNLAHFKNDDFLKEIIIINDYIEENPYDLIYSILCNYGLDSKLHFINNDQNYGQAMSRNIAAKKATGDYLHFIDQDDYISENFYFLLLNSKESDLLFGHPNLFYETKNRIIDALKLPAVFLYKNTKYLSQLKVLLLNNIAYSTGQYLISRKIFFQIKGYPDLKYRGCDDYGILFNLAFSNKIRMDYCRDAIFMYRIHDSQNRKSLNMRKSLLEFFHENVGFSYCARILKYLKINKLAFLSRVSFFLFFNK